MVVASLSRMGSIASLHLAISGTDPLRFLLMVLDFGCCGGARSPMVSHKISFRQCYYRNGCLLHSSLAQVASRSRKRHLSFLSSSDFPSGYHFAVAIACGFRWDTRKSRSHRTGFCQENWFCLTRYLNSPLNFKIGHERASREHRQIGLFLVTRGVEAMKRDYFGG